LQSSAAVLANKGRFLLTISATGMGVMLAFCDPVLAIIRSCSDYLRLSAVPAHLIEIPRGHTGMPAAFMSSVSSRVRSGCRVPARNALISTGLALNWSERVRTS
jgi:hypothetical protein